MNLFFQRYAQLLPLLGEDLTGTRRIARPAVARAVLARCQKAQPDLARIDLFATDGTLVASSGVVETSYAARHRIDPAVREAFSRALGADGLFIGRPKYGVLVPDWIVPLRMRVLDPRTGKLAFVISAVVRLDNQQALGEA